MILWWNFDKIRFCGVYHELLLRRILDYYIFVYIFELIIEVSHFTQNPYFLPWRRKEQKRIAIHMRTQKRKIKCRHFIFQALRTYFKITLRFLRSLRETNGKIIYAKLLLFIKSKFQSLLTANSNFGNYSGI